MANRKVRTRKSATPRRKSTATGKPAKRTTRAKKPTAHVLYANGDKTTRYSGFNHAETSAYSVGGLEALGLIKMAGRGKSVPQATGKERTRKELTAMFGPTMVRYWIKNDWIQEAADGGYQITVNGLNRISDRINNPSDKYGVSPEQIQKMEDAIKSGKGDAGDWSIALG